MERVRVSGVHLSEGVIHIAMVALICELQQHIQHGHSMYDIHGMYSTYVVKCTYHAFECVHEHSIGWEFPVGLGYIRSRNMSPACVQLGSRLLHLSDH